MDIIFQSKLTSECNIADGDNFTEIWVLGRVSGGQTVHPMALSMLSHKYDSMHIDDGGGGGGRGLKNSKRGGPRNGICIFQPKFQNSVIVRFQNSSNIKKYENYQLYVFIARYKVNSPVFYGFEKKKTFHFVVLLSNIRKNY